MQKGHRFFRSGKRLAVIATFAFLWIGARGIVNAQSNATPDDEAVNTKDSAEAARRLASRDPLERQQAAEELARLVAMDQQKMVSGYRLQEKNAHVKLALDWALYRMGKNEALFAIVHDLDSSRHNQAASYLMQLDSPEPLYIFLDRSKSHTKIRLLEVLAQIGDRATLARITPLSSSPDSKIAEAAVAAVREINSRLAQPQPVTPTRPRQVGKKDETTP